MAEGKGSTARGRPIIAVIAVAWVGLGFWAIKDGDMWRGAAGVALGALVASTYLRPDSRVAAFLEKPIVRRKKGGEQVGPLGRG